MTAGPDGAPSQDPRELLRQVWLRNRPVTLQRLTVVRAALDELAAGRLEEAAREEARGEAHKLLGVLGTYGFAQGSVLADEAEELLDEAGGDPSTAADLSARLEAYAEELQRDG